MPNLRPIDLSSRPSFQRDAEALVGMGPRAVAELLAEIAVRFDADDRRWLLEEYGPGDRLPLSSLGIELAVDEIYIDRLGPIVG